MVSLLSTLDIFHTLFFEQVIADWVVLAMLDVIVPFLYESVRFSRENGGITTFCSFV